MAFPPPYPPPPPPKKKLSTGKILAIGAGGVVAMLLLLGATGAVVGAIAGSVPDAAPSQAAKVEDSSRTTTTTTTASARALDAPSKPSAVTASPAANATMAKLETLPVKGRAPKTGYDRAQFGAAWTDDVDVEGGHNGCDTRNDVLRRDLTAIVLKPGSNGCAVQSGTLHDPYTGKTIPFTRGRSTSAAVQIDHVVALSDAWQKGAQQLSPQQRTDLANDPRNLQAVHGPANQQKGAGDAATWLPPVTAYRCTYVSRQIDVKALYHLWVTAAERDAMVRVLTNCGATAPSTPSRTTSSSQTSSRTSTPQPAPRRAHPTTPTETPTPEYTQPPAPDPGGSTYYANCTAVRNAGAAPIYAGQPGYGRHLDRDGDGVACEG